MEVDDTPNITCTVCGENDFRLKEGYYYCNECGTKTEQVRALEVEVEEFEDTKRKKTLKIKKDLTDKHELTSWECYNYILRGLVEELIQLGAKDELKVVVLQIWAAYLRNMEVAFFNRKHAELPKLGPYYDPRDASILYNHAKVQKKTKSTKQNTTGPSGSRREWRKQMKKFDQSQYESSMSQSGLSQSSFGDTSGNSSGSAPTNRAIQLKFSTKARKQLKKKIPRAHLKKHELDYNQSLTCHSIRIKKRELRYADMVMDLNMKQVYAILSLGLNLIEDDIQLTDLLHFIAEGHVSSLNVEHFFPENIRSHCKETLVSYRFYEKKLLFSVTLIREQCSHLAKAIHIKALKTPNIHKLVQRYITELCLPTEIYTFIERLINLYPPQMKWERDKKTPSYESRAMAYIVFTLKLLFGLDGNKEKQISRSTKNVNAQLATMGLQKYDELFVWDDWVEYIEMRKVILCNHSLTICKQFKEIPPREMYLQHLEERCKISEKGISKDQRKKQQNIEIVFQNFLQNIVDVKPVESIVFSPSFTPCHNHFKRIQLNPLTDATIPEFMRIDHSKRSIMPLVSPTELRETFAKCSRRLNVIHVECTSKRNCAGTFRNPAVNLNMTSCKVHFDDDRTAWELKVQDDKPAESIFKPVMEKYCKVSMMTMRKKELNRKCVSVPVDMKSSDDINYQKSIDFFEEDDMEPADICLSAPRRNLERINLFADISDGEEDAEQTQSEENDFLGETTTLKISNMDCWVLMGKASDLIELQSIELKSKLPQTFFWLLETCANTLGVDWTELYDQLLVLETFFAYAIEPLNMFEDRIVFKAENEIKDINKIVRYFKSCW